MTNFDLERKLPSCHITRGLLESLEKYILEKKKILETEIGSPPSTEDLTFSVTDNLGTESVGSTQQLHSNRFLDSTSGVRIRFRVSWYEKDTSLSVSVHFSEDRYRSSVTVISEGDMARELAVGLYESLSKIIETSKTTNWFFHPPTVVSGLLSGFLFIVLLVLLEVGTKIEYELGIPRRFLGSIFLTAAGIIYILVGPKIHPYITFDSPRADRLQSIGSWYKGTLASFLLCGIVLQFVYQMLFGS